MLGVAPTYLRNRHGPCPICGGKDRFRYDDKNGDGTYFCNQCGAGTGIILVRRLHGWDHATACNAVDEIIGKNPDKVEQARANPKLVGWFVGQVMKASAGKANPQAVNDLIKRKLGV